MLFSGLSGLLYGSLSHWINNKVEAGYRFAYGLLMGRPPGSHLQMPYSRFFRLSGLSGLFSDEEPWGDVGAKGNSVDTVIWPISLVRLSPNPVSTVIFVNSTQVILLSRHDRAIIANQYVSPLLLCPSFLPLHLISHV